MVLEVLEPLGMVLDGLDPLMFSFFNVLDPLGECFDMVEMLRKSLLLTY